MNLILAFLFVLILSVGNFIPHIEDEISTLSIKLIIISLLILVSAIYKSKKVLNKHILLYIAFTTVLFLMLSINSNDIPYSLDKYLSCSIVVICLYFIYGILVNRNGELRSLQYIIFAGFFILVLTILYKIEFGFWDRNTRFFLNGPILFSWLMGFYSILSIYVYKNTKRIIFLSLFVIFTLAVLWAESKGGLLATATALIFYLIYDSRKIIKIPILGCIGLFIFFNKLILDILGDITEGTRFSAFIRLMNNDVSSQDSGSITIRQDMLNEGYKLFSENWFFGIGLSNYQFKTIYGFIYPHNIHLEIFLECGIIVGLLYIYYLSFGLLKAPNLFKSILLLFIIASSFSGDATYLRFILLICLLSIAPPSKS